MTTIDQVKHCLNDLAERVIQGHSEMDLESFTRLERILVLFNKHYQEQKDSNSSDNATTTEESSEGISMKDFFDF